MSVPAAYGGPIVRASGRLGNDGLDTRLPGSRASTTFAGVELACASVGVGRVHFGRRRILPCRQAATAAPGLAGAAPARSVRAHSSIGQSPRLITGLFLVQIQVGPPLSTPRVRFAFRVGASTPVAFDGLRPSTTAGVLAARTPADLGFWLRFAALGVLTYATYVPLRFSRNFARNRAWRAGLLGVSGSSTGGRVESDPH
jgi:hypothetical protein